MHRLGVALLLVMLDGAALSKIGVKIEPKSIDLTAMLPRALTVAQFNRLAALFEAVRLRHAGMIGHDDDGEPIFADGFGRRGATLRLG